MRYPASSLQSVLWSRTSWTFPVAVVVLISCIIWCPVSAAVITNETAVPLIQEKSLEFLKGRYQHPLMHFTPDQLNAIRDHYEKAPRYNATLRPRGLDGEIPPGSKDLLMYLEYTPPERDQGWCGNCWVWASTGALEIENNVRSGIRDRLSIQYFNSRYNGGEGSNWACCGGWLGQFTSFYSGDTTAVPWSNTHAGYGDYYSYCEMFATAVPASSISTEPSYTISSISDSTIETRGIGQSAAIDNIKSALNSNKPVWYAFYYGMNGWNDFQNAWITGEENSVFDPTPYAGEENAGGHAVLIVGYDDTDPANPYWVVLNSWGTTGSRPHGLFRVNMSMDYDSVIYSGGYPLPQHMFSVLDADVMLTPPQPVNFTADITDGSAPLVVQFTDQSDVLDPLGWDWDFGDGSRSTSQNPLHEYQTRGIYSVTLNVTNSSGEYSRTRQNYITVTLPRPFPEFSASPVSGPAPLTVSFTDASVTDPATWAWFFGDEDYAAPWTEVNTNPGWTTRYGQSSVVLPDGSIVVTGGYDGSSKLDDVWRSADNGTTWTQMTAHAGWTPRVHHTTVAMSDGSIILLGGNDIHDESGYRNDVWRSTDYGATWEEVSAGAVWPGRAAHSSVVLADDSIVVMGGNTGFGGGRLNDVWRSTDYGATWEQMTANAGWIPRWAQSVTAMPNGSMILTAGWSNVYLTDVWRSTDKGATWTEVNSTLGGIERGFHSTAALPDNSILLMGGVNDAGGRNDVWRSTDGGATWILLTDNAAWSDRYYLNSLAMPDGRIILVGGRDYGGSLNDIWRVNPTGSQVQNPTHTYTTPGTYSVALQVMNASGINSTRKAAYVMVTESAPDNLVIIPLCQAGTPFGPDRYPQNTQESDPMVFSCTWNGTGRVYISGNPDSLSGIWADDGYTVEIQPAGTVFDAPVHSAVQHPVVELTSGMTPGMNTMTLVVRNWNGLSMWYGLFPPLSIEQTPSIVQVINTSEPAILYPDFSADPVEGTAPLAVSFSDKSIGGPTGWAWYFGDETYDHPWALVNADPGWSARHTHASVTLPNGTIIIMGGDDGTSLKNDVWMSADNGTSWSLVNANAGWQARGAPASAVLPDGTIVLIGGHTTGGSVNDVWQSSDQGMTWTCVNASTGWTPRGSQEIVVMPDGSIVAAGGTLPGAYTQFNDVWKSTDRGLTWNIITAAAGWQERYGHRMTVMPDESIVLTGGYTFGPGYWNDTWRSTDSGATWTRMNASGGWAKRYGHTMAAMPDGSLILIGGSYNNNIHYNDLWRSTDYGTSWTPVIADGGWAARAWQSSVMMPNSSIMIMGGWDHSTSYHDVWRLQPAGSTEQNPVHTYTTPGIYNVALQVSNANGMNSTRKTGYITVAAPASLHPPTGVGVFRPSNQLFILKNATERTLVNWGLATDIPVTGDWNGDGLSDIGIFRPSNQLFILKNGTEKTVVKWGLSTDTPVSGDWNGDGLSDIGIFRPSVRSFILKNGTESTLVNWGLSSDIPVSGDWNGDGFSDIGIFRPSTHRFILRNGTEKTVVKWGLSTDTPVTGDWNGDGFSEVGVFRPSGQKFILSNGTERTVVSWGQGTDIPVTGAWS